MRLGWFLYHVASGHAFFSGLALMVASIGIVASERPRWRKVATVCFLSGALLVFVSATPLPWFMYVVAVMSLGVWMLAERRRDRWSRKYVTTARTFVLIVLSISAAMELPYHLTSRPTLPTSRALAMIGDSISAGMGENEAVTWPTLIAQNHHVVVHDHSAMGATVRSAQKQAAKLLSDDDAVILEIGGNDMLGDTTAAGFERGLGALLNDVVAPGRTVIMLELPLPPTFNRFGMIQRRLAAKHDVVLLPKRLLMGVLAGSDATLDSIHLSQTGHQRLADAIWNVIATGFNHEDGGSR